MLKYLADYCLKNIFYNSLVKIYVFEKKDLFIHPPPPPYSALKLLFVFFTDAYRRLYSLSEENEITYKKKRLLLSISHNNKIRFMSKK